MVVGENVIKYTKRTKAYVYVSFPERSIKWNVCQRTFRRVCTQNTNNKCKQVKSSWFFFYIDMTGHNLRQNSVVMFINCHLLCNFPRNKKVLVTSGFKCALLLVDDVGLDFATESIGEESSFSSGERGLESTPFSILSYLCC